MKAISTGGTPYAIGSAAFGSDPYSGRFHVRCVRFGKLAASYERRDGEQIRAVKLVVADTISKPEKVLK